MDDFNYDDFIAPTMYEAIGRYGSVQHILFLRARDAGIKALRDHVENRVSEASQLERIYALPSPPQNL